MVSHLFCSKPCNVVHLKVHCRGTTVLFKIPSKYFFRCTSGTHILGGSIDLFTDTAAILNLLDLRSIMGCPGGTRSVFTRAFRAKRELHCIFLGKKAIITTSKHSTIVFFSHYNLFLGSVKKHWPEKQT